MQNLSNSQNLINLQNGDGLLFIDKSGGNGNTIDVSHIFSKIYKCIVTPWLSGENPFVTIPIYQSSTGGKIYMNSLIFTKSTSSWEHRINLSESSEMFASARCIVYGKLI